MPGEAFSSMAVYVPAHQEIDCFVCFSEKIRRCS